MTNLYGVETEADCRERMDELLEMHHRAEQTMSLEVMTELKDRLKEYYKKGDTSKGKAGMSHVETTYFWPAIREAYVRAPNLNSRNTWQEGLSEIESSLNYYRPRDKQDS
jgi:hypothetical protein